MFERNRIDNGEQGTIAVSMTFIDGSVVTGKVLLPIGKALSDLLNGANTFVEFEPYGDERQFIAKTQIASVKALSPGKTVNLAARLREMDGFDPYEVLGVDADAPWDIIKPAYLKLAMAYHPDRYATAQLPDDVMTYLATMARRINAAYTALEAKNIVRREASAIKQAPVYVSPSRGGTTGAFTR